jgi:hypothetical protein
MRAASETINLCYHKDVACSHKIEKGLQLRSAIAAYTAFLFGPEFAASSLQLFNLNVSALVQSACPCVSKYCHRYLHRCLVWLLSTVRECIGMRKPILLIRLQHDFTSQMFSRLPLLIKDNAQHSLYTDKSRLLGLPVPVEKRAQRQGMLRRDVN